jgi:hypothetical protein
MSVPGHDSNITILLESGIRFHMSKYDREKNQMPSGFAMKLRKHIRDKKLDDIRQMNSDRVVDFTFGSGDKAFHVILELYASGNIILTDHEYRIMNLLRTHKYDESVKVAVREVYPISFAASGSGSSFDDIGSIASIANELSTYLRDIIDGKDVGGDAAVEEDGIPKKSSGGSKKISTLKQVLSWATSPVGSVSPVFIDHALATVGIKSSVKVKSGWEGLTVTDAENFVTAIYEVGTSSASSPFFTKYCIFILTTLPLVSKF